MLPRTIVIPACITVSGKESKDQGAESVKKISTRTMILYDLDKICVILILDKIHNFI